MDESINDEPIVFTGLFADMFSPDFSIVTEKILLPGDKTMLHDITKLKETDIVGTSVRIRELKSEKNKITLITEGAEMRTANLRIRLPFVPQKAVIDGEDISVSYCHLSKTALLTFRNTTGIREIIIE